MTLPSGPTGFGSCFGNPGLPPLLCLTIWRMSSHLQPPLIMGGFPMDREPLLPYLTPDLANYCPVHENTTQRLSQLQPPLIMGGFPMGRGPLSPCLRQDLDNYCTVSERTGRCSIMQQDLPDGLACMYDDCAAIMFAEPPPHPVATTPTPPPVPSRLAMATPSVL